MIAPVPGTTLDTRTLNRAYLARQHLLQRTSMPTREMIAHLVGMQSQVPGDPFIGLWTRVDGFDPATLDAEMESRRAVRILTMRGTIHLLTHTDALELWPMMQADLAKSVLANRQWSEHYHDLDAKEVRQFGRQHLAQTPMTIRTLREHLRERWPDRDPEALSRLVHYGVPLVQIPPRGLWKRSMAPTVTPLDCWLKTPVPEGVTPDATILRYLMAFGPATTGDFRTWSRITGLKQAFDRVRSQLVEYRDERGRTLLDVPNGVFVDPGTPAPVRFLPGFDNALLSHDDRSRIVPVEARNFLASKNGMPPATFLVDGFVAGTWKLMRSKSVASIAITPFAPAPDIARAELEFEAVRLLRFLEPDAASHTISWQD